MRLLRAMVPSVPLTLLADSNGNDAILSVFQMLSNAHF